MSLSQFFQTDKFNLQQVVTPCIGSKKNFLIFRIIAFITLFYGFVISIYNYYYNFNGIKLRVYLPYFTNQSYIAINIYFILTIYLQIKDFKNTLPKRFNNENLNVLVHIFYWSLYNHFNIEAHFLQHLFQSIFLLTDWYLINVPSSLSHCIPPGVSGIMYFIFAQIYHYLYGDWIYDFLDTKHENWILTYIMVVGFWIVFSVIFSYVHMKKFKARNKEPKEETSKTTKNHKKTK
ncbi:hypothetical protein BCR36DRAFT_408616 [Piromyces finnis]|uniref:Uncharacterized protein n=1 Tax=Piromyces finnis TaxID=1754191 RepID=A0A1Y1VMG1_9FUNG|nr:hypothetical protein BCR36DRAFT_408616 [Piromyces finnis]|eukprot:ORX59084.1 hypothetical protein BCR36DRAFT_408616 [Piromyces finnis]